MNDMFSNDAKAAQLGFAVNQTAHIETEVNATVYPDIQYPSLVPVDTSAHPFARSVEYRSSDQYGKADWINGNSNDIPLAGTELAKHQTGVFMAGIGYGWGYEELGQAMMLGYPLQAEDAKAARRAYEEMVDRVAMSGDTAKGFKGLINYTGVTVVAATTGAWGSASAAAMIADVNQGLLGVGTATGYTSMADTLLLAPEKMERLSSTIITGTTETAYNFIVKNNIYTQTTGQPLTIRAVRGLNTAGAAGVSRMVAYRRDSNVLKLHIPMPHRFLPAFQDSVLNVVVPGVFRIGGLDIRRPAEVRYVDGL